MRVTSVTANEAGTLVKIDWQAHRYIDGRLVCVDWVLVHGDANELVQRFWRERKRLRNILKSTKKVLDDLISGDLERLNAPTDAAQRVAELLSEKERQYLIDHISDIHTAFDVLVDFKEQERTKRLKRQRETLEAEARRTTK